MRSISFSLTERQFLDGSKTVTRRLGWKFLKPGDRLRAVRKSMGLKKGEHPVVLGEIEVVSVTQERITDIAYHRNDPAREGFPEMANTDFVLFFCREMKCPTNQMVTRIEFRRVS